MIIYITTLEGVAPLVCPVPQSSGLFIMRTHPTSLQLSSVQFEMISVRSGKPICAPPRLSEASPTLPLKRFQCCCFWLTMALCRHFKEDRLALPLSTPLSSRRSMVWFLGFVPASIVVYQAPRHLISSTTTTKKAVLCVIYLIGSPYLALHVFWWHWLVVVQVKWMF